VTNVLIDEANRKHAEHAARAAAVAGAKSFEEARALGAAHAQKEAAERTNAAAYIQGVAPASNPRFTGFTPEQVEARLASRIAARGSRRIAAKAPAAPTVKAPKAPTPKPQAAKAAPALVAGAGDIAYRSRVYIAAQAKLGKHVTASKAVALISNNIV
jgi:hypothetical protein